MLNGRNHVFFGLIALLVLSVCSAASACTVTLNITGDYVAKGGVVFGSIEVSGTDQGTVTLTTNYTGTGRVIIWNYNFTQVVTTVNVSDCPVQLWVQGTTESSAIPDVTVTATLKHGEETKDTDSDTVTVVKVDKVQYQSGANWVDISGTLYVMQGTTVTFKAVPAPAAASWPTGKPVWGGTAGATGTGTTKDVTFNTLSSNLTDFKTVTAECGNTVTVNAIVYSLTGKHVAQNWFTGRSTTNYGVAEPANLSFIVSPTGVTAAQMGGLLWTKVAGDGTVNNTGTSGTGTYTAPATASNVTLRLTVQAGPSKDKYVDMAFTVVVPSGTRMTRVNTNVWHVQGSASAGIALYYWLDPKTVSFKYVTFGEDTVAATNVAGFYLTCTPWNAFPNGTPIEAHPQNTFGSILGGNSTTGCRVDAEDHASTGEANPYAAGAFTWAIPAQYIHAATRYDIGSNQDHVSTFQANGDATQAKGGQSGSAALNDATSGY